MYIYNKEKRIEIKANKYAFKVSIRLKQDIYFVFLINF